MLAPASMELIRSVTAALAPSRRASRNLCQIFTEVEETPPSSPAGYDPA
jgi:hypothetical protein